MVLKEDHVNPGDYISFDHYLSPVSGHVMADSGYSNSSHESTYDALYVDHACGFMFECHQHTMTASDNITISRKIVKQLM
jgi:hypothetical protein